MRRVAVVAVPAALAAGLLPGCGLVGGTCSGFALSLAVTSGGAPSPEAAARAYAASDDIGSPSTDWRAGTPDEAGVPVHGDGWTLHTLRGSDGTWFVDSGTSC